MYHANLGWGGGVQSICRRFTQLFHRWSATCCKDPARCLGLPAGSNTAATSHSWGFWSQVSSIHACLIHPYYPEGKPTLPPGILLVLIFIYLAVFSDQTGVTSLFPWLLITTTKCLARSLSLFSSCTVLSRKHVLIPDSFCFHVWALPHIYTKYSVHVLHVNTLIIAVCFLGLFCFLFFFK